MKETKKVLAKTPSDPVLCGETLYGHTEYVIESFRILFGTTEVPTKMTHKWLSFFGLGQEVGTCFALHSLAACALHDIGKANDGFQDAVRGQRRAQVIRHEHLSALLIWHPDVRRWAGSIPNLDLEIVVSAVLSHHLEADKKDFPRRLDPERSRVHLLWDAIHEVLWMAGAETGTDPPQNLAPSGAWHLNEGLCSELVEDLQNHLNAFERKLRRDDQCRRLLMAVRAALIAADSAGSGLVREKKDLNPWLRSAFAEDQALDGAYIDTKVIAPRVRQIANAKKTFKWSGFQESCEKLGERALLLAPCGSGKTLAAWRWIKAQLDRHPRARVLFLYPTRATATEGFRDYVSWAPEADSALIHGTAAYELEGMFYDVQDSRHERSYITEERLFAIGYWSRRVFSGTVHQFLGFM